MKKSCVLGFTAIAVAVILTGCLPTPPAWTTPTTSNGLYTGVIGDSITVSVQNGITRDGTTGTLTNDLTAQGYPTSVSSHVGATTNDLDHLSPFPTSGPTILAIALGTNDSYSGRIPLATSQTNLQNYLAASPAKCVYLVNISTLTVSGPSDVRTAVQRHAAEPRQEQQRPHSCGRLGFRSRCQPELSRRLGRAAPLRRRDSCLPGPLEGSVVDCAADLQGALIACGGPCIAHASPRDLAGAWLDNRFTDLVFGDAIIVLRRYQPIKGDDLTILPSAPACPRSSPSASTRSP